MASENTLWINNSVQFARLLSEIYATVPFTEEAWTALEESMDLHRDQIGELFERADAEWQSIKSKVCPIC